VELWVGGGCSGIKGRDEWEERVRDRVEVETVDTGVIFCGGLRLDKGIDRSSSDALAK
jgi:hypothetical protein